MPIWTDNRENGSALNKLLSTKFPGSAVVMELAAYLKKSSMKAAVQWAPRTVNQEADSLAKGDHSRFNPALRRVTRPAVIEWLVLPWALEMGRRAEVEHKRFKASGFDPGRGVKQSRRRQSDLLVSASFFLSRKLGWQFKL